MSRTAHTRPEKPILVDRNRAAAELGMGLTSFKEYVQPHLKVVRKGRLRLYRYADLMAWADANLEDAPEEIAA